MEFFIKLLQNREFIHDISDYDKWKEIFIKLTSNNDDTIQNSIISGFHSDKISYVFTSGYECALKKMFNINDASLCATESVKGAPPRSILTNIKKNNDKYILNGEKSFVTLGNRSKRLIVLAKLENELKIVTINSSLKGISFHKPKKEINFIPEIPHSSVRFENVEIESFNIAKGDGYTDYVKDFRTVEDLHVISSLLGYFLRITILSKWDEYKERIISLLFGIKEISKLELKNPMTHLLIDGTIHNINSLFIFNY
jgi:acyl-CoA dehydrogenase